MQSAREGHYPTLNHTKRKHVGDTPNVNMYVIHQT